jgi:hypothetical protein
VIVAVTLLLQIPFLNRGLSLLDEGSITSIADGLRHGELLYRDRITPLAPLTYELMRMLQSVLGPHLLVGRLLQAAVFTLCTLLMFAVLRVNVSLRWALWGALAFVPVKALGFPLWTMVNYSQIAMLGCLTAIWSTCRAFGTGRLGWLLGAGIAIGLTAVTKQNLGAYIGLTVAVGVTLDAARQGPGWLWRVCVRGFVLCVGASLPLAIVAVTFAARGNLFALVDRAIVSLSYLTSRYYVPLPDFSLWALDAEAFPLKVFAYFPTPLLQLWLGGLVDLRTRPLALTIEHAVKAAYYVPLCVLGMEVIALVRGRGLAPVEWSRRVLLVAFVATAYASMIYRADWAHLVNISPPILLLCVTVLWRATVARSLLVRLGPGVAVVWFTTGALMTAIVMVIYRTPVESPRGTVLAASDEAAQATRVLAYVARQPREQRIAFLRSEPLYYFLTDRRNPLAFDLLLVGFLRAEDDPQIAEALSQVDQVIYNPKPVPTGAVPITEYAPATAELLSSRFEVVEVLGAAAFVLKRTDGPVTTERVVVDLSDPSCALRPFRLIGDRMQVLPDGSPARVERDDWLTYQIITAAPVGRVARTCFDVDHDVGADESIVTRPIFHPAFIGLSGTSVDAPRVDFEIAVVRDPHRTDTIHRTSHSGTMPGPVIHASLRSYAGQRVTVRFCTRIADDAPAIARYAAAAWAAPRIVKSLVR